MSYCDARRMASVRPATEVQSGAQVPPASNGSEEALLGPPSPPAGAPHDADYGGRLREVEQLVNAPEWQAPDVGDGLQRSGGRLFPSDPRAVLVLLNEARYRAVGGVFGVRRDQVNLTTVIAAMMLAEAVHTQAQGLRRRMRGPTRADAILADGVLNGLGQQIAGPYSGEIPFFAALIGTAAVGAVATRVLRHTAHDMNAASHRMKRSFYLFADRTGLIPRSARSD